MSDLRIEMNVDEAQDLIEFYMMKRNAYMNSHREIFEKLAELDNKIEKYKKLINGGLDPEYPTDGSWNQKIQYFLRGADRGLTSRAIIDGISEIEQLDDEAKKRLINSIGPTLSTGYNAGTYDRYPNSNGEYVYKLKK